VLNPVSSVKEDARAVKAIANDPERAGKAFVESFTEDYKNKSFGERLGRGVSEVLGGPGKWAGRAAKTQRHVRKAALNRGVYDVNKTKDDDKPYIGQSGDINRRLEQHVDKGKNSKKEADRAKRTEVKGDKFDREIEEQRQLDARGGKENTANEVNPVGPKRQADAQKRRRERAGAESGARKAVKKVGNVVKDLL